MALAIVTVQLFVLMSVQGNAGLQTYVARRYSTATFLAREKITEVRLMLEREGFGDNDLEEEGDFEEFTIEEDDLELEDMFEGYRWAYTVREVDLSNIGDFASMGEEAAGMGYFGEEAEGADLSGADTPGLEDMGVGSDMITDMLSPYMRELRVRVWWDGIDDDGYDPVEIVTHVVNPSGQVVPGAGATGLSGEGNAAMGSAE